MDDSTKYVVYSNSLGVCLVCLFKGVNDDKIRAESLKSNINFEAKSVDFQPCVNVYRATGTKVLMYAVKDDGDTVEGYTSGGYFHKGLKSDLILLNEKLLPVE